MSRAAGKDAVEIFGYAPDDISQAAQELWTDEKCPFLGATCVKWDREARIHTGICTVNGPTGEHGRSEVIACWGRLYAEDYKVLRVVSAETFGSLPFYLYDDYLALPAPRPDPVVVAIGKGHGKEIGFKDGEIASSLDWVLAVFRAGAVDQFIGLEVQSIDTTGNMRDNRADYATLHMTRTAIPIRDSGHGLNWANVWKRLIPQLILKGPALKSSALCKKGLFFVLPDEVYKRFEHLAPDIPQQSAPANNTVTVYTWGLGDRVAHGDRRELVRVRHLIYKLDDLILAFTDRSASTAGVQIDRQVALRLSALTGAGTRRASRRAPQAAQGRLAVP